MLTLDYGKNTIFSGTDIPAEILPGGAYSISKLS